MQDSWFCVTCVRTQLLQQFQVGPYVILDKVLGLFFNDPTVDWVNVGANVGSPGFCLKFRFGCLIVKAIAAPSGFENTTEEAIDNRL